jgi:hypothetical protein
MIRIRMGRSQPVGIGGVASEMCGRRAGWVAKSAGPIRTADNRPSTALAVSDRELTFLPLTLPPGSAYR